MGVMAYGVLLHRPDSIYDDRPEEQYQFPRQYLKRVEACMGDWIVYLEPGKVPDTRGYFAIARVQQVVPDPKAPGMYLALMELGSFLPFASSVPFRNPAGLMERGLLNEEGRLSGRAQSAVRPLSASDLARILEAGLDEVANPSSIPELDGKSEFGEEPAEFIFEQMRERVELFTSRIIRERVFRKLVLRAYDQRCVMTGLKLINGGGRAEVVAAHIRPVEANGPDIVSNGLALSGTAHWMFDRGLISLGDDLQILISRQANDPDGVKGFLNRSGRAIAPQRHADRPHVRFLQWHRENCFKH
jgi:putative restriction endonuclease